MGNYLTVVKKCMWRSYRNTRINRKMPPSLIQARWYFLFLRVILYEAKARCASCPSLHVQLVVVVYLAEASVLIRQSFILRRLIPLEHRQILQALFRLVEPVHVPNGMWRILGRGLSVQLGKFLYLVQFKLSELQYNLSKPHSGLSSYSIVQLG